MNQLTDRILKSCDALGLKADIDYRVELDNGRSLQAVARIRDLGAPHGMLIFHAYDEVKDYSDDIQHAGYGYSILDEPLANEEFDIESYKDMFLDWGWSASNARRPDWMKYNC